MVAVDDKDMPTGLAILVDGKDSEVKTGALNEDLPMIGPLPIDKALTISITVLITKLVMIHVFPGSLRAYSV